MFKKTVFLSLVMMFATFSHANNNGSLVDMLQSTSEFYAKTVNTRKAFSCVRSVYKGYEKAAGLQKGVRQSLASTARLTLKTDPTDAAANIGQYIGTVIGYQLLSRKSDEILTFYKASACAIQKAKSMDMTDPNLIFLTVGAVAGSGRYAEDMNAWFENNAKNGDINLDLVHKGQDAHLKLSAPMVDYVSAMADMSCDITEEQADQIHNDYIVNTFLSKMGGKDFDEFQEACAVMLNNAM